jgi:hypothetical protein
MTIDVFHTRDRVSSQGIAVYKAKSVLVSDGVNLGDPIGDAADIALDDCYRLVPGAKRLRLAIAFSGGPDTLHVDEGSELGVAGAPVHIDCCVTFMAPDGTTLDALVLVELEPAESVIAAVYLLPLGEMARRTDYSVVEVDRASGRDRFAELACVSFARGTRITAWDGTQRPIEQLGVGDRVLTRNNGVQEIRWIGQRTVRAAGAFAPIIIRAGALHNNGDLMLSPNQRIFVYQRKDHVGAGRPEVMVKAEHLVNGSTVIRASGGFVDYYQLLFDDHEIVYAEGVATESQPLDAQSSPTLPKDIREKIGLEPKGRTTRPPVAVTLTETMIDSRIAAEILRKSSTS